MNQKPSMGMNRTGIATSPIHSKEMVTGVDALQPSHSPNGAVEIAQVRREYAHAGERVGSVPPPAGVKQAITTVVQAVTGAHPLQLIDKLGDRLAFERTGTRLYDALLSKFDAYGSFDGGPSRAELEGIRAEEHEHFIMLRDAIEGMGGDPTAMTPSADLQAVLSAGVNHVLVDPRTTLLQCLEAMLVAELNDNEYWPMLAQMARDAGNEELAIRCERATAAEERHLAMVRRWVAAGQGRDVDAAAQ